MSEIIKKLEQHQPETPSKWREKAEFRLANKSWLRYSQHVAISDLPTSRGCVIPSTSLWSCSTRWKRLG